MEASREGVAVEQAAPTARRGRLAGALALIDAELPLVKYLGFALWVAWFGIAYNSAEWLTPTEASGSVVTSMFVTSTLAHVVALIALALPYRRTSTLIRRPWFILAAALVAAVGGALIILAGPRYLTSQPLFLFGSALTGLGTAPLCLNAGLLLCALGPGRALRTVLVCELVACLVGYLAGGVPYPIATALFVGLPLLSSACLIVGCVRPGSSGTDERSRLAPTRELWRLLLTTFILCVSARLAEGFFTPGKTPDQLAVEGSVVSFITLVCLVVALLALAWAPEGPGFSRMFYPMAVVLLLALLACGLFQAGGSFGVVVSNAAFQLLDIAMWCACAYVVSSSKVSALLVVGCVRVAISLGVTLGAAAGSQLASVVGGTVLPAAAVFALLIANLAMLFFVFPERRVKKLLLPIPDEDEPGSTASWGPIETNATPAEDDFRAADDADAAVGPVVAGGYAEEGRLGSVGGPSADGEFLTVGSPRMADSSPETNSLRAQGGFATGYSPEPGSPGAADNSRAVGNLRAEGDSPTATPVPGNVPSQTSAHQPSALASGAGPSPAEQRRGTWKALCLQMADEMGLTDREKEVFVLLAKGRGSQSISDALTVSLYTTRAHTRNIYAKLDVHSRHELSERVTRYVEEHQA